MSSRTDRPGVVLLFGPTGVGKTALLDRLFAGRAEVVSADALQVYKGLDIGTAKPDSALLSRIPHHLINILDFTQSFSVVDFVRRADAAIESILSRGLIPVISGGTAYYFRGWLLGLPGTPAVNPDVRSRIESDWQNKSNGELQAEVRVLDPVSAGRIGAGDRYRMLRVLEVHAQSGSALSEFTVPSDPREDFEVLCIGLRRERVELYRRINSRVDEMFEAGLGTEVSALRAAGARREDPGMKAIGYREWFGEKEGDTPSPERVRDLIARNSRRYAKRQMTFFSSLPAVRWFDATDNPDMPVGLTETVDDFIDGRKSSVLLTK